MGMFNIILLDKPCPKCGSKVEWQTKDLVIDDKYPVVNILKKYTLNKRMSCEVYTCCDKCKVWTGGKIVDGKPRDFTSEKALPET